MKNILIAGHYNLNNGDRAVLEATVQQLLKLYPNADITVSAHSPELLSDARFSTVPWPVSNSKISFKLALMLVARGVRIPKLLVDIAYLEALNRADLVLFSGGHHLTDLLGTDTFCGLAMSFLIPLDSDKKMILLPQTIGPIIHPTKSIIRILNRIFIESEKIYVRDNASRDLVHKVCPDVHALLAPDVVYGLKLDDAPATKGQPKAGIALYCNYATEEGKKKLERVIDSLVGVCGYLVERGYGISIIPMEIYGSSADDRPVARELIRRFEFENPNNTGCVEIEEPDKGGIQKTVEQFAGKEIIYACKTHSVVFSMLANSPLVGIAYHSKSIEFMNQAELGDYAVFDEKCSRDLLIEMTNRLLSNAEDVRRREREFVRANAAKLSEIFEELGL